MNITDYLTVDIFTLMVQNHDPGPAPGVTDAEIFSVSKVNPSLSPAQTSSTGLMNDVSATTILMDYNGAKLRPEAASSTKEPSKSHKHKSHKKHKKHSDERKHKSHKSKKREDKSDRNKVNSHAADTTANNSCEAIKFSAEIMSPDSGLVPSSGSSHLPSTSLVDLDNQSVEEETTILQFTQSESVDKTQPPDEDIVSCEATLEVDSLKINISSPAVVPNGETSEVGDEPRSTLSGRLFSYVLHAKISLLSFSSC